MPSPAARTETSRYAGETNQEKHYLVALSQHLTRFSALSPRPGVEPDARALRQDAAGVFNMPGARKPGRVRFCVAPWRCGPAQRQIACTLCSPLLCGALHSRQRFLSVHFDRSIREWDASVKGRHPVRTLDTGHTQAIMAVAVDVHKCVAVVARRVAHSVGLRLFFLYV